MTTHSHQGCGPRLSFLQHPRESKIDEFEQIHLLAEALGFAVSVMFKVKKPSITRLKISAKND